MTTGPDQTPAGELMRMLAGKWIVQALATAAELELGDRLAQPKTLDELARECQCQPDSLLRLLRVLQGEGVIVQRPQDERFALTPVGEQLRADALRDLAMFVGSPPQWTPWTELTYAVRTGKSAFEKTHGQSLFDYLADHPDKARLYDDAIDAFSKAQAQALADSGALDGVAKVVDVGGGRGTVLLELLRRRPSLHGVLFDHSHVVEAAAARFHEAGMSDRVTFEGGDFFETMHAGADAYVLKHVVHNWDDDRAVDLLKRCAAAMAPGGRLLIVEGILLPGDRPDGARLMDLEMLVLTGGGRERSKPGFRRLFATAGLRLQRTEPLASGTWLLVAVPR